MFPASRQPRTSLSVPGRGCHLQNEVFFLYFFQIWNNRDICNERRQRNCRPRGQGTCLLLRILLTPAMGQHAGGGRDPQTPLLSSGGPQSRVAVLNQRCALGSKVELHQFLNPRLYSRTCWIRTSWVWLRHLYLFLKFLR